MATKFTKEEVEKLVSTLEQLNLKPKSDSPEDLKNWMEDYVKSVGVKQEPTSPSPNPQTLTMSHFPKICSFSGDGKGGTTYDLWKYEVMCLNKEKHSQDAILQAIRMSLKGEAGRVLMRLGPKATVDSIVRKMNSVYGEVDQTEMVLAKFYSAKQQPDEDVSSWGCRLEDLLNSAIEKGKVTSSESNDMLRVKFWSGLRESIQDITGYLYERIEDFDDLRIAIRRIEQNHKQPTDEKGNKRAVTPAKAAVDTTTTAIDKLTGIVNQLAGDIQQLKQGSEHSSYTPNQEKHSSGRTEFPPRSHYPPRAEYPPRNHYPPRPQCPPRQYSSRAQSRDTSTDPEHDEPTCWRCGQVGHVQLGCRVRIDHRRPLNGQKSAARGRR